MIWPNLLAMEMLAIDRAAAEMDSARQHRLAQKNSGTRTGTRAGSTGWPQTLRGVCAHFAAWRTRLGRRSRSDSCASPPTADRAGEAA